MVQRQATAKVAEGQEFGTLLFTWRGRIKRTKILVHLPGWSKDIFYRLEKGDVAPSFEQLLPLYRALWLANVPLPAGGPQVFLKYAREKIDGKKTHLDRHSEEAWAELSDDLLRLDHQFRSQGCALLSITSSNPLLLDTSHLVRRDGWHEQLKQQLTGPERKKVIVVVGPSGIGKTSELSRFAVQLRRVNSHRPILCDFRSAESVLSSEEALDVFLGTVLSALGCTLPQAQPAALEDQVMILLEQTEKSPLPVAMILDHAECILNEQGKLARCWERFLARMLKYQHQATLILATRQWPAWFAGDFRFLAELPLPPLEKEQGIFLLQQLGLKTVSQKLLHEVCEKVGGLPACLEWVAALAKQPVFDGDGTDEVPAEEPQAGVPSGHTMTRSVRRLLSEPHLFGGTLAEEMAPLLDQILSNYRLSVEARELLGLVSLATVPLAKPALDVLYPQWPRAVRELRRASLLVTYPDRILPLPSVAAAVARRIQGQERFAQEEALIGAYQAWLQEGVFYENEKGAVVSELATLQLSHGQLLPAAETLIRYGWLAFHLGHTIRLARLSRIAIGQWEKRLGENGNFDQAIECGKWLLQYLLGPFLGEKIDSAARTVDYERLMDRVMANVVTIQPHTELFVTRYLMVSAMEQKRFADAQHLVERCEQRLEALIQIDPDVQTSLLEKHIYLLTNWCEYAEQQGDATFAQQLRQKVIAVCQQSNQLLTEAEAHGTPLKSSILKKRLAKSLTNLGYHLNRVGQFEQAREVLLQSISLKEQGYTDVGSLPASYGELSQTLAEVGNFEEALRYDELALNGIECLGDTISQETAWIYRVNRGRLYVKVGRLAEARHLLEEAIPQLPDRWEMYRMFGRQALNEIKQRTGELAIPTQYDMQWINRYRDLISFDSFAWLAPAHFTPAEQVEWKRLATKPGDLVVKKTLETMLADSKERELLESIQEGREPRFFYPAIPLEEVQERIRLLLDLAEEIRQREENVVVRRFYIGDPDGDAKGAIPYQIDFLRMIEATALGDNEAFWRHICAISPPPTEEEMAYALSRVKWFVQQGWKSAHTEGISQRLNTFFMGRLSFAVHSLPDTEEMRTEPTIDTSLYGKPIPAVGRELPPEAVRAYFAQVLRDQGCQGWEAVIDYAARNTRIEPGLRHIIVAGVPYTLSKVNELIAHELGAHIAPRVAGERSALGILGLGSGWSLTTEEGLGLYFEWELAKRTGQRFDEAKIWLGTLATGLAAGVLGPPLSFLSLYTWLADFLLLYRLIFLGNEDFSTAQAKARAVAQTRCLRTYRGVPDLSRHTVCYPKDAVYQRGFFQVYDAVAHDETILDWLTAGSVSLEQVHELAALGVAPATHAAQVLLAHPDFEANIQSFVESESKHRILEQRVMESGSTNA